MFRFSTRNIPSAPDFLMGGYGRSVRFQVSSRFPYVVVICQKVVLVQLAVSSYSSVEELLCPHFCLLEHCVLPTLSSHCICSVPPGGERFPHCRQVFVPPSFHVRRRFCPGAVCFHCDAYPSVEALHHLIHFFGSKVASFLSFYHVHRPRPPQLQRYSLQSPTLDFVVRTGECGRAWQSFTRNVMLLPWTPPHALDFRTQWGEEDGSRRHADEQNQTLNFKHNFINNFSNVRSTLRCIISFLKAFLGSPAARRMRIPVLFQHVGINNCAHRKETALLSHKVTGSHRPISHRPVRNGYIM